MTLTQEVKFILNGGDITKIKIKKDGRYTKSTLKYLADNQIAY